MLLLRHMNWNKERLIEKYMDNPIAVNVAAGIPVEASETVRCAPPPACSPPVSVTSRRVTRRSASAAAADTLFVCPICCTDAPPTTLTLHCGHAFCSECWTMYITSKIREEGEFSIRCMATDCSLIVPDTFIQKVTEPQTFS